MKRVLFISFSLLCIGCTKEITNENYINYAERVELTSEAQSEIFTLSDITTTDWTIEPVEEEWLSAERLENQRINVIVESNDGIAREGIIKIKEGNIENRIRVWQDCERYIRTESSVPLLPEGQSIDIPIETNLTDELTVQVTSSASWLEASIVGTTLKLRADAFRAGGTPRTANLRIIGFSTIGERVESSVVVTQNGDGTLEYVFDVPEFTQSWVYKVMYNGVQIAEVCKEYINDYGVTPVASLQAIVVYPMGSNGKADLTKGFVAQVLKARNPDDESYPAPTGNIHGGSVGWDKEGNCVDAFHHYTNGTSEKIRRVFISSDRGISGEGDYYSALYASTESYTISDKRGDEKEYVYPVVKIATQYWLQKSLMTTRNRDGSPITTNLASSTSGWGAAFNSTPRTAIAACCVRGYNDANSSSAQARRENEGVLYSFPCISNEPYLDSSNAFNMSVDANNNLTIDNLSPEGWEIPDIEELSKLFIYIGGTAAEMYVPGTNVARVTEYLNDDGTPNPAGREDENITGMTLRSSMYRLQGSATYPAPTSFFIWSRTYSPNATGNENPGGRAFNRNGEYDQSMMRALAIRCLRK